MENSVRTELRNALIELKNIIPNNQYNALRTNLHELRNEDVTVDQDPLMLSYLQDNYKNVPGIYAADGEGRNAIVHLHYFNSSSDWFITELDKKNNCAFGYVILNGDTQMSEFGYIYLEELRDIQAGIYSPEVDQHWTPKTLNEAFKYAYPELAK